MNVIFMLFMCPMESEITHAQESNLDCLGGPHVCEWLIQL